MVEVKSTAGMVIGSMEFEEFWLVENVVGTQTTYELIWMNFTSVMARTIVECFSLGLSDIEDRNGHKTDKLLLGLFSYFIFNLFKSRSQDS